MTRHRDLTWSSPAARTRTSELAADAAERAADPQSLLTHLEDLAAENHRIHNVECVNLNPATNVMNPRAEALQSAGLSPRPSLGHAGDKYEMGLEAIEQIEVTAAELAAEVFDADYAEVRVGSGALANLYAFLATTKAGDKIIAPPASIGGHVTHHKPGSAGLRGLVTMPAPVDPTSYTVDVDKLRAFVRYTPNIALITVGGSLNLFPHPVAEIRAVADEVGAKVLFDAAHLCGMVAGGAWENPLHQGAHLMTMSTYKSLGGPAGGLVVTNDAEIAERLDAIAYPGLTANSDAGRIAALAVTMLDWRTVGPAYAAQMVANARRLADTLMDRGVPLYAAERGATASHQLAVVTPGGGQAAARRLRVANLLACGIGIPGVPAPDGDTNGLRLGTPEVTRLGMREDDMEVLAGFVARGLAEGADDATLHALGAEVTEWRRGFSGIHFTVDCPA